MLFSIITITRNNLAGLQKTSASVLANTCNDIEWIVVDGASEDGSVAYLQSLPFSVPPLDIKPRHGHL